MTTTKRQRLDRIAAGSFVRLNFNNRYEEKAVFLGVEGTGDKRRAKFLSTTDPGKGIGGKGYYEWEAYRYNGGWAFGSSAERLILDEVLA